jgi:hypothetical protein
VAAFIVFWLSFLDRLHAVIDAAIIVILFGIVWVASRVARVHSL